MHRIYLDTIAITRMLAVMMTLVAMLFVSSAQGFSEECSEETTSQEIELLISRRVEPEVQAHSRIRFHNDVSSPPKSTGVLHFRQVEEKSERAKLNGTGSYLRI